MLAGAELGPEAYAFIALFNPGMSIIIQKRHPYTLEI